MSKRSNKARQLFGVYIPPITQPKLKAGAVTLKFVVKGHIPSKKNNQTVRHCFDKSVKYLKETIDKKSNYSGQQAFDIAMKALNQVYIGYIGNKEYAAFVEENKPKLIEQAAYWSNQLAHRNLVFPLSFSYVRLTFFWHKDYNHDTLNKAQSIQDLLKDSHIISDDNYKVIDPVHLKSNYSKDWVTDNVCLIQLTIN